MACRRGRKLIVLEKQVAVQMAQKRGGDAVKRVQRTLKNVVLEVVVLVVVVVVVGEVTVTHHAGPRQREE